MIRDLRKVLVLPWGDDRYGTSFMTQPYRLRTVYYQAWLRRFLEGVRPTIREDVRIRPSPEYLDTFKPVFERLPWLKRDETPKFERSVKDARIVVIGYLGSTWLEVLAKNQPCFFLLPMPMFMAMSKRTQKWFIQLSRAESAHYYPDEAARHLNRIYRDPWAWWMSKPVQEARANIMQHYPHALSRREMVKRWWAKIRAIPPKDSGAAQIVAAQHGPYAGLWKHDWANQHEKACSDVVVRWEDAPAPKLRK